MITRIFTHLESLSNTELQLAITTLPDWRRKKVEKYHFEIDRKLSTVAFTLLRDILRKEYNISCESEWGYMENGKPFLVDNPSLHFNLSHCHNGVVCVVNSSPVGVDIESIREFDLELAEHISSSYELHKIKTSSNPAVEFTKLWTKKESYMKYLGIGLVNDLPKLLDEAQRVNFQTTICEEHGYVMTICTGK